MRIFATIFLALSLAGEAMALSNFGMGMPAGWIDRPTDAEPTPEQAARALMQLASVDLPITDRRMRALSRLPIAPRYSHPLGQVSPPGLPAPTLEDDDAIRRRLIEHYAPWLSKPPVPRSAQ